VHGQDDSPTFKTSTQLVLVPVVVKDRKGHVVSGLKATDFFVTVDKKSQTVAQFEEVSHVGPAAVPKAVLKPGEYSNARVAKEPIGMTIIMLDLVNTPFVEQARARDQLIKFLAHNFHPNQYVSLLALTSSGLRQIHDFTNNSDELLESVRGTQSEVNRATSTDSEKYLSTNVTNEALGPSILGDQLHDLVDQEFREFRMTNQRQLTLEAMVQVAQAYKATPGRKNLVWTTAGFPFYLYDPKSFASFTYGRFQDYESVWRRLNDANISVYPVDVRGVFDPLWDAQYSPMNANFEQPGAQAALFDYWSTRNTMSNFADATGGHACIGNNDMAGCYADVVDDASDYYLVSFYLAPPLRTEGWHELKVKVNGSYHVRARRGFTISNVAARTNPDLEVVEALRSPIENDGLPFTVELGQPSPYTPPPNVLNASTAKKKPKVRQDRVAAAVVPFKITIAKNALTVDTDHQNRLRLRIEAALITDQKEILSSFSKVAEFNLSPEGLQKFSSLEFTYADSLYAPSGTLRVRFALLDMVGNALGTVEAPLRIPK
jgi:VWFA-related protein